MTLTKLIMAGIPFLMLADFGTSDLNQVSGFAEQFMKYGELGLCFVLVAYLMYSNYMLVASLQRMIKEKSAQEERLINAIQTFCAVCRERPCLLGANAFKTDDPHGLSAVSQKEKDND